MSIPPPTPSRVGQPWWSAGFAAAAAAVILVVAVLPAERGIDPTGLGGLLGLARMGDLKARLDAEAVQAAAIRLSGRDPDGIGLERRLAAIEQRLAALQPLVALARPPAAMQATAADAERRDETVITLGPDQGAEVRLRMRQGARAGFRWSAEGGALNVESDGVAPGRHRAYADGRGVRGGEGTLVAAFDGAHGWHWRNRGPDDVTLTLRTEGAYGAVTRPAP